MVYEKDGRILYGWKLAQEILDTGRGPLYVTAKLNTAKGTKTMSPSPRCGAERTYERACPKCGFPPHYPMHYTQVLTDEEIAEITNEQRTTKNSDQKNTEILTAAPGLTISAQATKDEGMKRVSNERCPTTETRLRRLYCNMGFIEIILAIWAFAHAAASAYSRASGST